MPAANSTKTAPGRPFKPGQSGNPSGRPKIPEDVRELIRAACPEAAKKLIKYMDHSNPKIAMWAITEVLDRGYGKPIQMQDIQLDMSASLDIDAQIRRVLVELNDEQIGVRAINGINGFEVTD